MHYIFDNLNEVQKQAITTTEGPLLLLSGAGTGKTKVLTSRIIHIMENKLASPREILAVTFTNKAANEIKNRIAAATLKPADSFWIGTFHSIGLRILRRHYKEVGLKEYFTIIDTSDSEKIVKNILAQYNVDTTKTPASMVMDFISRLKDKAIAPDNVPSAEDKNIASTNLSNIYTQYQARLGELNCVDFGDLIFLCIQLFRQFPDILTLWQNQFKYINVDEYQDTNAIQYLFVRLLSLGHKNIFCVGDDDQSIYSWRGADIGNILRFEKEFENAKVMRMEQNYRSESYILKLASSLISHNRSRYKKNVWSDKQTTKKAIVKKSFNSKNEANWIADEIKQLHQKNVDYKDIALLIRASYQSRELEERLIIENIPYRIFSGAKFYERAEIKDMIAYIRLIVQPYDDLAYLRVINSPKRGIGKASLDKIVDYAKSIKLPLLLASHTLAHELLDGNIVSSKIKLQLLQFTNTIESIKHASPNLSLGNLLMQIALESGYIDSLKAEDTEESKGKIDNIKELSNSMDNYSTLEEFLEHVSLVNDKYEDSKENEVTIMTLHAAKGLEFDTVFLAGFEDGILPNARSLQEQGNLGLEEERRLAYVGITRAKSNLYISYSDNRYSFGSWEPAIVSRFLDEMDKEYLNIIKTNDYQQESQQLLYGNNFYNKFQKSSDNAAKVKGNPYSFDDHFNSQPASFNQGSLVTHATLGEGVIESISSNVATVKFADDKVAKIMIQYLKPKNYDF